MNAIKSFFAQPAVAAYLAVQGHNLKHLAIAFDQFARMLVAIVIGSLGWSDETLSAYAWRAHQDGKIAATFMCVVIDVMFLWQKSDPTIVDDGGVPIESHCHRAFVRECRKEYLPPAYRSDPSTTKGATP